MCVKGLLCIYALCAKPEKYNMPTWTRCVYYMCWRAIDWQHNSAAKRSPGISSLYSHLFVCVRVVSNIFPCGNK